MDQAYEGMINGEAKCMLAFDISVVLKHGIKTMAYLRSEKVKQDPLTWKIEFLNMKILQNTSAFFTYDMLQQNQRLKRPFYPRNAVEVLAKRKNPYEISKQEGEIRIVACDMAFVENKKNDNSIFSCMRLLPEYLSYNRESGASNSVSMGYHQMVSYMESIQGGDTFKQARRIRQLYEDFQADYIVLDLRNAGVAVYDLLAKVMYDEERQCEYSPLTCMNDDKIANRIKSGSVNPRIYVINATQGLNDIIAREFYRVLSEKKIDLLVNFETAQEEILPNIKEYNSAPDAETQIFFETPFLETQQLISETTALVYERKEQTGAIVIKETGSNRKDRYTSVSYGVYFASELAKDLLAENEEYEYSVFIN